ncbi:MAG: T9SS type A sorting domain-containing protein [Flavobacteriales bacterium]
MKKLTLLFISIFLINSLITAQIQYDIDVNGIRLYPVNDQLYPRDGNDEATVIIRGTITNPSLYDDIKLIVTKTPVSGSPQPTTYNPTYGSTFSFSHIIEAGMHTYKFKIELRDNGMLIETIVVADNVVCGDVYVVAGQSNAVAGAWQSERVTQDANYKSIFSKTFGVTNYSNQSVPYNSTDNFWSQSYCNHNWSVEPAIGVWALKLQYRIQQEQQMPTCIINGVEGGSSIEKHQLEYSATNDPLDPATNFGALNYKVHQANYVNKIKGVIWYQGESNSGTSSATYKSDLDNLITNWENSSWGWDAVDKIYIVQIHTGCGTYGNSRGIREVQRTFINHPDHNNIEIISANGIGSRKRNSAGSDLIEQNSGNTVYCHFDIDAYNVFADRIFDVVNRDFYCSNKMSGINSPNIQNAYFEGSGQVVLEFDQNLASFPANLEDFFFFVDGSSGNELANFISGESKQNKVILDYSGSAPSSFISYLGEGDPTLYPTSSSTIQRQMFWLKNPEGNAAFSFHKFPIGTNECSNNNYDQELCGTVSTSTIKDKYITNCNVDCGSGYTNINSGSDVELRAQNTVHFKPGFKAYSGSTIHAYISSPDNCTTAPASRLGNFSDDDKITATVDSKFVVYPNPFSGVINVESINSSEELDISIFNTLGKLIYSQEHTEKITTIDMNNQPNGIYFIQINNSKQTITKKIIKQ